MTDTSSDAEISFQQAMEAFNSSNLDLAIDLFKTTISLSPDHADAYNHLGEAHFKKEEYQDSVDSFNKALEIQPNHTQAKSNLGVAQWNLDNLNRTISESAENIEGVNQDTLHRSPEPPTQPVESAINEKDDQITTAIESEQPIFLISEAIRFGWNTMKNNLVFFIAILIVSMLIGIAPDVIERLVSSIPIRIVVGIPFWVLNLVIWMGLIRIALRLHDNKDVGFTDLFSCFPLFFNYLFGSILYGLIIFVGMILLIIPGIIWAIKFQFYSYFIVDEGLGPIEALKRSSLITKGSKWNLFLFGLLLILINVLGALCLLVGLFATIPTAMIAVSFVYRKLAVTDVKETY